MTDTNERAVVGGNNPPDPIDEITAAYDVDREEAESWADGSPVETEGQANAVDALRESMRQWRLSLEKGQKAATAPLREVYQAELDRWKPTIEDAKRIEGCLVTAVSGFKVKQLEAKKAAERAAWAETERLRKEAEAKATAAAASSDIAVQREAQEAKQAALDAELASKAASKDKPKGMRTVTHHEVVDMRALVNFIAKTDKDAMAAFATEYARKHHEQIDNAIVRTWTTKEAV